MKPDPRAQMIGPCTKAFALGSMEERAWLFFYENFPDAKATPEILALIKFSLQECSKQEVVDKGKSAP